MNNKSVLKVAGINGQPVTVEDWTVSDQIAPSNPWIARCYSV